MKKVFIDGSAGTTGLRIFERLKERKDIELLEISEADRKNAAMRKRFLNSADVAFLCLPDSAAIEAVSMVENPETVIIDASTAHRTAPGWVYGFAELSKAQEEAIKSAKRIANPGCHASGFIALVYPLISAGIIKKDIMLSCYSLTGYSGGGKKMIEQYAKESKNPVFCAPRQYGLNQEHKHLKEMTGLCSLTNPPVFCPVVSNFYSGMEVTVPLFSRDVSSGSPLGDIRRIYAEKYNSEIVEYSEPDDGDGMISAAALSGKDSMIISAFGNSERIILTARYDNLGKGASGAAIENMNIALGLDKTAGLEL